MIKQAYISCPLTIPSEDLENVIKRVKSFNLNKVHYYSRGTVYNTEIYDQIIDNSDAFILVLPGLAWASDYPKLTTGCRREFDRAMRNPNMQLFIAYRMTSGTINIYNATIEYLPQPANATALPTVSCIKGLNSTSGNFAQEVVKDNEHTKATAPATKPKTSWPGMIQEQAEIYKIEEEARRQREKAAKLGAAYRGVGLYEQLVQEKKVEYAMPKDPKKFVDLINDHKVGHPSAVPDSDYVTQIKSMWVNSHTVEEISKHYGLHLNYIKQVVYKYRGEKDWQIKTQVKKDWMDEMMDKYFEAMEQHWKEHVKNIEAHMWNGQPKGLDNRLAKAGKSSEEKWSDTIEKYLDVSNNIPKSAPIKQQPLAALLPKEAEVSRGSDFDLASTRFGIMYWEADGTVRYKWYHDPAKDIDQRLLMFF